MSNRTRSGLFEMSPYRSGDKDIFIYGPDELRIAVDYDDVDRTIVVPAVEKLVTLLNRHWWD